MKTYIVTYGEGGYDESKPNNNLISIEEIEVTEEVVEP